VILSLAPRKNPLVWSAMALVVTGLATSAHAAEGNAAPAELFRIGPLPVTNAIATTWVVSLLILVGLRMLVGTPKMIPGRGQALVESALQGLKDLFEPIVGKRAFASSFPLLVTLFLYIVLQNWSGLLPGVGTIGWGYEADGVFHVTKPFIRPANSDWNGTIALAAVSMLVWGYVVLRHAGPKVILHDLFGNKASKSEIAAAIYYPLSLIFIIVGFIEIVSIAIRPFTLSVRLFGNVFGGENLLHATGFVPPFYFLETLVGLVQALVFTLLVSIYIGLLCNHGDDHAEEHH
jgi:F-type H+-transporting ATPase subunit a